MRARTVEAVHAGLTGDQDGIGPADEQPALDHPDDAPDAFFQPRRIGDDTEAAVENTVATVGDESLAGRRQAQSRGGPERLEGRPSRSQPEGDDFDGNRRTRPEPIDQFFAVDDDGEALAGSGNNFFTEQGTAQALDEIKRPAFDLVRAVDCEIDQAVRGE